MEELIIGLVILWAIVLVIVLIVLLISIFSLTTSLSKMEDTVKRVAEALASGKAIPAAKEEQPAQATEPAASATISDEVPEATLYAPVVTETPPSPPIETPEPSPIVAEVVSEATSAPPPEPVAESSEVVTEVAEAIPVASQEPPAEQAEEPPATVAEAEVPREPTALQRRLQMLRNWFVYGRAEGVTEGEAVEKLLATTWLLRCGILVILFTSAFLLKLSIDRGILAPSGRVALSYLAGAGVLWAGLSRRMRQRYWSMAQALCGISLGIFYFSSFAMTSMYHLVPATIGGAVMCLTTVTAGVLADRLNSISVAMVAMIGGYATPLLLNTGVKNFPGLAAYLVLLGVGVLWLASRRNWLQLSWLAMLFTYGIFALAINAHYAQTDFAVCQISLVLFFVLFSTTVFIHNVRRSVPATALEIFGLLGNSAIFFGLSWGAIATVNQGDKIFFAPLTLGLAAYYLSHAAILSRRRDAVLRTLLLIFCALSGFYLALTFPVVLSGKWLAAAWSMQAFMMLWLGHRMESKLLKNCAWILYALTLGHLACCDFWLYETVADSPEGTFWAGVVSRVFQYLVPVASLAGAARLTMRSNDGQAVPVPEDSPLADLGVNSLGELVVGGLLGLAFVVSFLFLRLEIGAGLRGNRLYCLTGINLVWVGGCLAALAMLRKRLAGWWQIFLAILLGGIILRGIIDFCNPVFWRWGAPQFLWGHCFGALANTAILVMGFVVCARKMPQGRLERILELTSRIAWPILLFVHLTREWGMIIKYKLPGLTGGGISVLWAIFAFVLVFRGLKKANRCLRYLGLGLFTVVVCKVFLFDMSHLDALYRVMAFFAAGVLLMGAAFVYLKFWRNSNSNERGEEK